MQIVSGAGSHSFLYCVGGAEIERLLFYSAETGAETSEETATETLMTVTERLGIVRIALLKLNVEGAEIAILEHLLGGETEGEGGREWRKERAGSRGEVKGKRGRGGSGVRGMEDVVNIQVQFHVPTGDGAGLGEQAGGPRGDGVGERGLGISSEKVEKIRRRLNQTHCLTYSFPYVWENWRLRQDVL